MLEYTLNPEKFKLYLAHIEKSNKAQAQWMTRIDPGLWLQAYFLAIRWGFKTSQFAEVMNKALLPLRGLCAQQVVKEFWQIT